MQFSQHFTSPLHPQSNGLCERMNKEVLAYLRKYLENTNNWEDLLPALCFAHNTHYHASTHYSPFQIAFNRNPRLTTSLTDDPTRPFYGETSLGQKLHLAEKIHAHVRQALKDSFIKQKTAFDKRAKLQKFKEGDTVYISRPHSGPQFQKFQQPYMGPYRIIACLPNSNFELLKPQAKKPIVVHGNRIKMASFAENRFDIPTPSSLTNPPQLPSPSKNPCSQNAPVSLDDDSARPLAPPTPVAPHASPPSSPSSYGTPHSQSSLDSPSSDSSSFHGFPTQPPLTPGNNIAPLDFSSDDDSTSPPPQNVLRASPRTDPTQARHFDRARDATQGSDNVPSHPFTRAHARASDDHPSQLPLPTHPSGRPI